MQALAELTEPLLQWVVGMLVFPHPYGTGALNQKAPRVAAASLPDPIQRSRTTNGQLPRYRSHPRGQITRLISAPSSNIKPALAKINPESNSAHAQLLKLKITR